MEFLKLVLALIIVVSVAIETQTAAVDKKAPKTKTTTITKKHKADFIICRHVNSERESNDLTVNGNNYRCQKSSETYWLYKVGKGEIEVLSSGYQGSEYKKCYSASCYKLQPNKRIKSRPKQHN